MCNALVTVCECMIINDNSNANMFYHDNVQCWTPIVDVIIQQQFISMEVYIWV